MLSASFGMASLAIGKAQLLASQLCEEKVSSFLRLPTTLSGKRKGKNYWLMFYYTKYVFLIEKTFAMWILCILEETCDFSVKEFYTKQHWESPLHRLDCVSVHPTASQFFFFWESGNLFQFLFLKAKFWSLEGMRFLRSVFVFFWFCSRFGFSIRK